MNLKDTTASEMACSLCFFKNPLPWIALLAPCLLLTAFLGCGILPLLFTVLLVTISSIFFTFSKHHTPVLVQTSMEEDEAFISVPEESGTITQQEGQADGYMIKSSDSFSESESIDQSTTTDQDSEVEDWPYSGNAARGPDCSDGSISDEESLIEIALPSGYHVGPEKEGPKFNLQKKFQDFGLMDINEMNDEDNLIEIDISAGSIKCSRIEIDA